MYSAVFAMALLLQAHVPAHTVHHPPRPLAAKASAAMAPVSRIDSLIATEQRGRITIDAKGAVAGGGWKRPALRVARSGNPADAHVLVLDFVAEPPDSDEAVIPGLLPVSATLSVAARKGLVSVRAVSGSNEITSQILKSAR